MRSYIGGKTESIIVNDYDLIDAPGSKYDYSQVTSDLLGLILERATGKPYGEYLSESLIQPIAAQGGQVMMNRPNGLAHTGCCLLLPSESWLRMGLLLLNSGNVNGKSLFPDGWMQEYLKPSPGNPAFGLHIWLGKPYYVRRGWMAPGEAKVRGVLHSEPYLADDLFLFDGNGHQVVYIIPSQQLVIVRTGGRPRGEGLEWDNAFIPNTVIRGLK
jgi:CubicO group peptidase (beta-lactamase class C family)